MESKPDTYGLEVLVAAIEAKERAEPLVQERNVVYDSLQLRLDTFLKLWKKPTPQQFTKIARAARAGYFYSGVGQEINCYFCLTPASGWERDTFNWDKNENCPPHCAHAELRAERFNSRSQVTERDLESAEEIIAASGEEWRSAVIQKDYIVEQLLCRFCKADDINSVLTPCGHMMSCLACVSDLEACPTCGEKTDGYVRAHLPDLLSERY